MDEREGANENPFMRAESAYKKLDEEPTETPTETPTEENK
jgi:hypothetical protein